MFIQSWKQTVKLSESEKKFSQTRQGCTKSARAASNTVES